MKTKKFKNGLKKLKNFQPLPTGAKMRPGMKLIHAFNDQERVVIITPFQDVILIATEKAIFCAGEEDKIEAFKKSFNVVGFDGPR